ncbi:MAG: hypothetical protein GYA55_02155 [SAR324 cluster bacterium]|uniref:Uncharacterized protein n=1 Tax=SAR324 cluster bacterium TaxID=2024889 RepID=A0A7X9FPP5_9DELT|nr:hypothetical protein [SAR324 cluster bacterium]
MPFVSQEQESFNLAGEALSKHPNPKLHRRKSKFKCHTYFKAIDRSPDTDLSGHGLSSKELEDHVSTTMTNLASVEIEASETDIETSDQNTKDFNDSGHVVISARADSPAILNKVAAGLERCVALGISQKKTRGLSRAALPCTIKVDELELNRKGFAGQYSHRINEQGEHSCAILLNNNAALAYGVYTREDSEDIIILPHELRHHFFARLGESYETLPYDGALISTRDFVNYDKYLSFEEFYTCWKDCQRLAREVKKRGLLGPKASSPLGRRLVIGADICERALACINALASAFENGKAPLVDFNNKVTPVFMFSFTEWRGHQQWRTNLELPLALAYKTGNESYRFKKDEAYGAVRNAKHFIEAYMELFVSSYEAWESGKIEESDLIFPKDPEAAREMARKHERIYSIVHKPVGRLP